MHQQQFQSRKSSTRHPRQQLGNRLLPHTFTLQQFAKWIIVLVAVPWPSESDAVSNLHILNGGHPININSLQEIMFSHQQELHVPLSERVVIVSIQSRQRALTRQVIWIVFINRSSWRFLLKRFINSTVVGVWKT